MCRTREDAWRNVTCMLPRCCRGGPSGQAEALPPLTKNHLHKPILDAPASAHLERDDHHEDALLPISQEGLRRGGEGSQRGDQAQRGGGE